MPLPKDQRPGPTTWSYLAPPPDWLPVLGNAPTEPRPLCLALAPSHRASVGKSSLDLPTPGRIEYAPMPRYRRAFVVALSIPADMARLDSPWPAADSSLLEAPPTT